MISLQAGLSIGSVKLKDIHAIIKYFDGAHTQFSNAAVKVHRKTVFEVLIYLMRLCPVLTGRLRGSWTPFLDKYGKQPFYMKYLNDKALTGQSATDFSSGKKTESSGKISKSFGQKLLGTIGMDGFNRGKKEEFFSDGPLITTLGSNVVYAGKVNESSKYMDRTMAQAQMLVNRNFENFIQAAREAGWIPDNFKDDPKQGGV